MYDGADEHSPLSYPPPPPRPQLKYRRRHTFMRLDSVLALLQTPELRLHNLTIEINHQYQVIRIATTSSVIAVILSNLLHLFLEIWYPGAENSTNLQHKNVQKREPGTYRTNKYWCCRAKSEGVPSPQPQMERFSTLSCEEGDVASALTGSFTLPVQNNNASCPVVVVYNSRAARCTTTFV